MTTHCPEHSIVVGNGILNEEYHARLISDLDHYAQVAGVPAHMIKEPMALYCSLEEVGWIRNIMLHREKGVAGLCLTGEDKRCPVATRMQAMAAALLRNYVDARVVTMSSLLESHDAGDLVTPTVMLIPNFYVQFVGGKPNTNWQLQILQDILMRRMVDKQITIIYIESMVGFKTAYGGGIQSFIEAHWTTIAAPDKQ